MNKYSKRGLALIIIMVILSILAIYSSSNIMLLTDLRQYLDNLEKHQRQKFTRCCLHRSVHSTTRPQQHD